MPPDSSDSISEVFGPSHEDKVERVQETFGVRLRSSINSAYMGRDLSRDDTAFSRKSMSRPPDGKSQLFCKEPDAGKD